jgi:hypothetical protein
MTTGESRFLRCLWGTVNAEQESPIGQDGQDVALFESVSDAFLI